VESNSCDTPSLPLKELLKANMCKVKLSLYRPEQFQEAEAPRISGRLADEGGKVVSSKHRPPLPGDTASTHLS
jgi:hypothetical protein